MTALQAEIREKEAEIIQRNKGKATLSRAGLARELGAGEITAHRWAAERGIGIPIGDRVRYEVRQVAKYIVQERGMY